MPGNGKSGSAICTAVALNSQLTPIIAPSVTCTLLDGWGKEIRAVDANARSVNPSKRNEAMFLQ